MKTIYKLVSGATLAVSLGFTPVAQAADLDVNIGLAHITNNNNLLWRTPSFPWSLKIGKPSGEIGLTENVWASETGHYGLNARESFVWLGEIYSHALTPTRKTPTQQGHFLGSDFIGGNGKCVGECTDMSSFDGTGHNLGFTLQLESYYKVGDTTFAINGGAYINRSTWSVQVKHIDNPNGNGGFVDGVVESQHQAWSVGEVIGASISKGNITIRYQYFRIPPSGEDPYPPAWQGAHMLSIGYRF